MSGRHCHPVCMHAHEEWWTTCAGYCWATEARLDAYAHACVWQQVCVGAGGGGGSAGLAPALVWAGAWLPPPPPAVVHLVSWGVGDGNANFSAPAEAGSEKLR